MQQNLFGNQSEDTPQPQAPLAARMRPRCFEEFVGQQHLIGKDRVLRRSIEADKLSSMIFWGPPGTGKTTLAEIIASRPSPTSRRSARWPPAWRTFVRWSKRRKSGEGQ